MVTYQYEVKEFIDVVRYIGARECDATYLLPAIQRQFVWMPSQILKLWDSILRGYPIGTILIVESSNKNDFYHARSFCEKFTNSESDEFTPEGFYKISENGPYYSVLDGQQRLQSIAIGVNEESSITMSKNDWHNDLGENNDKHEPETRYLFIRKDFKNKIKTDNQILSWRTSGDSDWERLCTLDVKIIMNSKINILNIENCNNETFMLEIFLRLNTAGTVLTREQIHAASLKNIWPESDEKIKDLRKSLVIIGANLDYDEIVGGFDVILKAITSDKYSKNENMETYYGKENISDIFNYYSRGLIDILKCLNSRDIIYKSNYSSLHSILCLVGVYCISKIKKWEDRYGEIIDWICGPKAVRWIFISQWAKIWSNNSSQAVEKYISKLIEYRKIESREDFKMEEFYNNYKNDAIVNIESICQYPVPNRGQISKYKSILWAWSRLSQERVNVMFTKDISDGAELNIDHIIPFRLFPNVRPYTHNSIGNCMLIPRCINSIKSDDFWGEIIESKSLEYLNEYFSCKTNLINDIQYSDDTKKKIENRSDGIKSEIIDYINIEEKILIFKSSEHERILLKKFDEFSTFNDWLDVSDASKQSYISKVASMIRRNNINTKDLLTYNDAKFYEIAKRSNAGTAWKKYCQFRLQAAPVTTAQAAPVAIQLPIVAVNGTDHLTETSFRLYLEHNHPNRNSKTGFGLARTTVESYISHMNSIEEYCRIDPYRISTEEERESAISFLRGTRQHNDTTVSDYGSALSAYLLARRYHQAP